MLNKKERDKWMSERMSKGYSFTFKKGLMKTEKNKVEMINKSVVCIETGEEFEFIYFKERNQ